MDKKVKDGKPLTTKPSMTLVEMRERFSTEDACKTFIRDSRWPDGVVKCPRCGNDKIYALKARPWHWQCQKCAPKGYRFSVTTGTVFENTKYPLRTWFEVAYTICQAKKGISALQIYRTLAKSKGSDYRTFWFMCHRIRSAMRNPEWEQLMGEVEIDETWIGGKAENRAGGWRDKRGRGPVGKTPVIGAIARKGNVVAKVIDKTDTKTLDRFVRETVSDKVSLVATDEHPGYRYLRPAYPHVRVSHKSKEYVRGNIHTNNIESFWSLLKRGIVGTFHNVSKDYLPLYLNEFAFRHNNRRNPEIFEQLLSSV